MPDVFCHNRTKGKVRMGLFDFGEGHDVIVMRWNAFLQRVTVLVSSSSAFVDDLPAITGCPIFS